MVVGLVILGVLAAVTAAGLALFTMGEAIAITVLVLILIGIIAGIFFRGPVGAILMAGFAIVFVGSIAFGGWSAYQVVSALTDSDGPADPADPVALASIERKLEEAEGTAGLPHRPDRAGTDSVPAGRDCRRGRYTDPSRYARCDRGRRRLRTGASSSTSNSRAARSPRPVR